MRTKKMSIQELHIEAREEKIGKEASRLVDMYGRIGEYESQRLDLPANATMMSPLELILQRNKYDGGIEYCMGSVLDCACRVMIIGRGEDEYIRDLRAIIHYSQILLGKMIKKEEAFEASKEKEGGDG